MEIKYKKLLFVCLGNICRSPVAEGVFRHLLEKKSLSNQILVDSAGTGNWHAGEAPDLRTQQNLLSHGIDISSLKARQLQLEDFTKYDLILVMDKSNLEDVVKLAKNDFQKSKVHLLRNFDPEPESREVPDPYYGGKQGFENVYQIVKRSCEKLIERIAAREELNY